MDKRFSPNLWASFSLAITIAVWLAFAPMQVGGIASYIIVIGDSMEPEFHKGDLVITHRQPVYQVGDAVVYRNREVANYVFHRIVSQQLGRYALQGDNNSWMDNYQPSYEEIVGKLWLHIPRGGSVIQKIRSPFVMALLAGSLGAVLAASLLTKKAGDNKRMKNKSFREWLTLIKLTMHSGRPETNNSTTDKPFQVKQGEILEGYFFMLGLILFISFILGMIAFSRPVSRIVQDDISYQHLAVFSYTASTPQGVYDTDTIRSGDPIFTKLTCSVDVSFTYSLVSGQIEDMRGTYQMTALLLEQSSGWQRLLPLQETATFTGPVVGTTARLDLCQIQSLVQSMEEKTDFHAGTYTLVITPNIQLEANVDDHLLSDSFSPTLAFRYDRLRFYLVRNDTQENPLTVTETGTLPKERREANTVLFLGKEIAVYALRLISVAGFLAALAGIAFLGLRLQNLSRLDQEKYFRMKYYPLLIDVQDMEFRTTTGMIDVDSMEALAKLAERFNGVILHGAQGNRHTYIVQADGNTFRFTMVADQTESAVPEPVRGVAV